MIRPALHIRGGIAANTVGINETLVDEPNLELDVHSQNVQSETILHHLWAVSSFLIGKEPSSKPWKHHGSFDYEGMVHPHL